MSDDFMALLPGTIAGISRDHSALRFALGFASPEIRLTLLASIITPKFMSGDHPQDAWLLGKLFDQEIDVSDSAYAGKAHRRPSALVDPLHDADAEPTLLHVEGMRVGSSWLWLQDMDASLAMFWLCHIELSTRRTASLLWLVMSKAPS